MQVLVELASVSAVIDRGLLQRRFAEQARGYERTLKYLEGMQALKSEGQLVRSDRCLKTHERGA